MDIEFDVGTIIFGGEIPQQVELNLPGAIAHKTEEKLKKENTRKRVRNPESWKQNIRNKNRQSGEEYVDIKGRTHEKRSIKYGCQTENCKFHCSIKINEETRREIHESFWKLSDSKKNQFYNECVVKVPTARKRTKNDDSKKSLFLLLLFFFCSSYCSFYYYFKIDDLMIRVCKHYFLHTLDVSSQRIYYYFKKVHSERNIPRSPLKGKNTKKVIAEAKKEEVRNHIRSFKAVESHYCRACTNKTYLQTDLNLSKMYRLYC